MSEEKPKRKILKYLRPVLFGVGLYVVIVNLPIWILKSQGFKMDQGNVQTEEEPIYKDKNGKVINIHDYNLMKGYDYAASNGFTAHSQCKEKYSGDKEHFLKSGCQKYVTEKHVANMPKHIKQGPWNSGKTTAQCLEEVEAYWKPRLKEQEELGDYGGSQDYADETQECENYDKVRVIDAVYNPTTRIETILKKLENGEKISPEEHDGIIKDMELVKSYPEDNKTIYYFNLVDRFFILAARNANK